MCRTSVVMKPARGSGRASTRGPKHPAEKKTSSRPHEPRAEGPRAEPSRTGRGKASAMVGKSWKPMSKSSLLALENMLGLSILSVLALKNREKEGSQMHLNRIKDRFLAKCAQLPVPTSKHGDLMRVSHQFKAERDKSQHGKKTLESLEENMRSVVSTLEEMEVKMARLEEKCRIMRSEIEDEEEKAQEFLQLSEQTVLRVPAVSPRSANEPTLQEHLMKLVPNPPAVARALQAVPVLADARAFLELAHEQVDSAQTRNHMT
ncbi:centromere protein Q isoform X2 [Pimephales promelas]|uniref:centromere protein Q isoform X2 n=1 Tax=Pimephales promelas TaxID=90988 RepID=UPI0019554F74|nr:centromere protein Q isoform X2 [Pimephales promelas]